MYREAIELLLPDDPDPDEEVNDDGEPLGASEASEKRSRRAGARKATAIRAALNVVRLVLVKEPANVRERVEARLAPATSWGRRQPGEAEEDARKRREADAKRRVKSDEIDVEKAIRYLYLLVASAPEHARGYLAAVCDAAARRLVRRDHVRDPGTVTAAIAGAISSTGTSS